MAKLFGNRMKDKVDAREELVIPTYTLGKKPRRKGFRAILITSSVVLFLFLSIYMPPMLLEEPDTEYRASVDLTPTAERLAMEEAQTYLRNNPEADFDSDGLTNEEELAVNTGIYMRDNDGDGVTDYAELYLTETNPCVPDDAILNFVINADSKTGSTVNTPFKVGDVVLWADDYASKARGSVLQLSYGSYNFYRFKGWVQFPEGNYAYKVENGLQTALKKSESGYFYIDTAGLVNVRLYEEQPTACHIVSLLGTKYMLPDNFFTQTLSFILPSKGFGLITCRPALANDIDGTWSEEAKANAPVTYQIPQLQPERFARTYTELTDLAAIFHQIDNGNNVILSLMSHEVGESIVEVYGYTNRNNLLICEPTTGENLGVINIIPYSERLLDESGTINSYEQFAFSGCGYSSAARHRIAIIDYVSPEQADIPEKAPEPEPDVIIPPVTDDVPEAEPSPEATESAQAES